MTKQSQHTPGPWMTDWKLYSGQYHVGPVTQPSMTVAKVNGREGEQEANARLIALAPEMLEALKVAHDALAMCRSQQHARSLGIVSALIARAEGGAL